MKKPKQLHLFKAIAGNHLHLIIKVPSRENYRIFVRVLSSRIAVHIMKGQTFKIFKNTELNQERGDTHPAITETQGLEQQFWQFRPWSRVLYWGRDFKNCCEYVMQNTLEALGFIGYKPRKDRSYCQWHKTPTTKLSFQSG